MGAMKKGRRKNQPTAGIMVATHPTTNRPGEVRLSEREVLFDRPLMKRL
jgi:hypothetical protein